MARTILTVLLEIDASSHMHNKTIFVSSLQTVSKQKCVRSCHFLSIPSPIFRQQGICSPHSDGINRLHGYPYLSSCQTANRNSERGNLQIVRNISSKSDIIASSQLTSFTQSQPRCRFWSSRRTVDISNHEREALSHPPHPPRPKTTQPAFKSSTFRHAELGTDTWTSACQVLSKFRPTVPDLHWPHVIPMRN